MDIRPRQAEYLFGECSPSFVEAMVASGAKIIRTMAGQYKWRESLLKSALFFEHIMLIFWPETSHRLLAPALIPLHEW